MAELERLHVLGQLPLQVLGRVRSTNAHEASLHGDSPGLLAKGSVLPIQLNGNLAHAPESRQAPGLGTELTLGVRPQAWRQTPSVASDPL